MSIKFAFLPHSGESILITIDENQPSQHTILLDGGYRHPFRDEEQPEIDTIIVTHIDCDHIQGIIDLLEENAQKTNISRILFNEPKGSELFELMNDSTQTSKAQGKKLKEIIDKSPQINADAHQNDICFEKNNIININATTYLRILTPTMETLNELHKKWDKSEYEKIDTKTSLKTQPSLKNKSIEELANLAFEKDGSLPNKSSISFILYHNHYSFLLLGDAHIDHVNKSLVTLGYDKEALIVDFVKASHHGSRRNINPDFLKLVKTNKYIICPTHHDDYRQPDKETIAKIAILGNRRETNIQIIIGITKDLSQKMIFTNTEKKLHNFNVINLIQETFS